MRKHVVSAAVCTLLLIVAMVALPSEAMAQARINYRVTIYNLTNDQIFSPPIIATHTSAVSMFKAGTPASAALRALAEDGGNEPLRLELSMSSGVLSIVTATAPILPGASASYDVVARGMFDRLSAAGMLVTTNDAFFGLDSLDVDFDAVGPNANIVILVPAYDAGTESNNEICGFIPGPPCGNGGVRDTSGAEGYVSIHRGIHGGADLDPARFDWRNPVAKIVITRIR